MGGATSIHSITEWPSLSSPSFTRSPIGSPYGSLPRADSGLLGELRVYHVPLVYLCGLGPSSTPVALHLRQMTREHLFLSTHFLVQACGLLVGALQHLWLVLTDDAYRGSLSLTIPRHPSSSTALMLAVATSARAFVAILVVRPAYRTARMRLHCPQSFAPCRYQKRTSG
jgi:hypothetical protein